MKIIGNLSALVTLIGFLFPFLGNNKTKLTIWQDSLIILTVLFLLALIIWEWFTRPKTYKNQKQIDDYMFNWISHPGRTLIFTRDMTWVAEEEIKEVLRGKARRKELIICMPKKLDFAAELEVLGAEIIDYINLKYSPKSRFTIIRYGKLDTKMAIGKTDNKGVHHIEEVENGIHTEYHLAEDLFEVLKELKYNG